MQQIPLSIFIIILLVVLVIGCKFAKKGEFYDDFMDYSIVKGLQGFAALGVILHHVTQEVTQYGRYDKGAINFFVDTGVLFTGLFFFFSGYGLIVSLKNKKGYLDHFLKKRLLAVLIPFIVCNLLFIAVNLIMGFRPEPVRLVLFISGFMMMNDQMWFIVELAVLYVVFYLVFRKRKSDAAALGKMAACIFFMNGISLLLGHDGLPSTWGLWFFGEWWYNTTWLFFIGMVFAMYYDKIIAVVKKNYRILLPVGLALCLVLYIGTMLMIWNVGYWVEYPGHRGYLEKFLTFCVQCPMVIAFDLTFMLITMKVQFKNRFLEFLGRIALEMYLLQNIFITKLTTVIKNDVWFYLAVYCGTILLAMVVHRICQLLLQKITSK